MNSTLDERPHTHLVSFHVGVLLKKHHSDLQNSISPVLVEDETRFVLIE